MSRQFDLTPQVDYPRSKFDLSHTYKSAFVMDKLIPVSVIEIIPGDTMKGNFQFFGRLNPTVVPIMDNITMDTYSFFVPNRLVWENWQRFNGEQDNPGDSTDYLVPEHKVYGDVPVESIYDYMGIPPRYSSSASTSITVNELPFRAYDLIYKEWFRDQNLIDSPVIDRSDAGRDSHNAPYKLYSVAKYSDYFTRALPSPQKGPGVELPLGGSAPVFATGSLVSTFTGLQSNVRAGTSNISAIAGGNNNQGTAIVTISGGTGVMNTIAAGSVSTSNAQLNAAGVYADLSSATAITIDSLREAFQLQRLYERDARGGTRYTEILRSHFGVTSPDARLQRPEFLAQSRSSINVHVIPQTSSSASTPQANLAGHSTVSGRHFINKSFTEHGYMITLVCIRSQQHYQQGLDRMWSRKTRFDFFWPVLQHLGEQAILNKEIYVDGSADDDEVFGYVPRYEEYKFARNQITGKLRSKPSWAGNADAWSSLDAWHLAQRYTARPALNQAFIESNIPITRTLAYTNEPPILFDAYFQLYASRVMSTYSVPGMVDHF